MLSRCCLGSCSSWKVKLCLKYRITDEQQVVETAKQADRRNKTQMQKKKKCTSKTKKVNSKK